MGIGCSGRAGRFVAVGPARDRGSIKYRNRPFLEPRQLERLRFFLPSSSLERRWFAALSITAGFCEELLFRGFLLRYLHTSPLHLGLVWATLAAALVLWHAPPLSGRQRLHLHQHRSTDLYSDPACLWQFVAGHGLPRCHRSKHPAVLAAQACPRRSSRIELVFLAVIQRRAPFARRRIPTCPMQPVLSKAAGCSTLASFARSGIAG